MKATNETDTLQELILATEKQEAYQLALLREQLYLAKESLKPINLIKDTLRDITTSPDTKSDMVNNLIALGTGFLSKKLFFGNSTNAFKNALGTAVEFSVSGLVSKYADDISDFGNNLWKRLWNKDKS